jgi:hypothetical protein
MYDICSKIIDQKYTKIFMTFPPTTKKPNPLPKTNVPRIFLVKKKNKINVHIGITEVRCFGEIPL